MMLRGRGNISHATSDCLSPGMCRHSVSIAPPQHPIVVHVGILHVLLATPARASVKVRACEPAFLRKPVCKLLLECSYEPLFAPQVFVDPKDKGEDE